MPARHPSSRRPHLNRTSASAPGKIILLGEHAVVYGRPAIAVPFQARRATAVVTDRDPGAGPLLHALDLGQEGLLESWPESDPLALAMRLTLAEMGLGPAPDWRVEVSSQIPIASGLGSGAAVATALVRSLFLHGRIEISCERISSIVFRSEEIHHGTPSGIDNTVIAYEAPVWFIKGQPLELFTITHPLTFVVADSGLPSPTRETVADVARMRSENVAKVDRIFEQIGQIVERARRTIEDGEQGNLGSLMDQNHRLLREIGVSSPRLDELVQAATGAGALGAKLSGGGRGGNIIALTTEEEAQAVVTALLAAGARSAVVNRISS